MLDELEWPSLEARKEQSSLTPVQCILRKNLAPIPNLRRTRVSHESQYTRFLAYSRPGVIVIVIVMNYIFKVMECNL